MRRLRLVCCGAVFCLAVALAGNRLKAQSIPLPAAPVPALIAQAAAVPPPSQSRAAESPKAAEGQPSFLNGPPLTRTQAEALALRQNPRITVNHLLVLAQLQVVRETRSGELPQLIGSITGEAADNGSRLSSGSLSSTRLLQHVGGGVSASQLITDFGRTRNLISSSKLEVQAQEQSEQATRQDVVLVTDQAFYGALQAQAVLRVAEQTVATRQATQRQIAQLTKNNLRSTLDQSFANINVSQAQLLLLGARNQVNAAMATLDAVLGFDRAQDYTLVSDTGAPPPPPPDVDVLLAAALRQRPDLLALESTKDSQQKLSQAQSDQRRPSVSLIGTVGGEPVRSAQYYDSSWDGGAAANIQVPLFNGFLYSAQAKEEALRAQATGAEAKQLRDAIVRDVRSAWLEAQNSFAQIGVTQQLLGQANLSLKLAKTRYNLGLSSIVELTDAQLAQTQAAIAACNADYGYRAALSSLAYQTGQSL